MKHYNVRSNIESTFSSMKKKFSDTMISKKNIAQINEILCEVVIIDQF